MMILYGLPGCDSCRAATKALSAAGREVSLRDVRAEPLTEDELAELIATLGPALVNRRSTTWRGLSEAERVAEPLALLAAHPTLMKRPVLRDGGRITLGWDKAARVAWGLAESD